MTPTIKTLGELKKSGYISKSIKDELRDNLIEKIKSKSYMHIPVTRLRWYSVSECLYGESLYKLLDTKK